MNYLALTYHLLDNRDSPIYYWKQAVTQNLNFELGYYNLGLMHDYQGDQEAALENYNKEIEIDTNSKKALYNKASILYVKNELSTALKLCKKAISVDSNYVLPLYLMSRIYLTRGVSDSAHLVNSKLVTLEPNNPEYLFYLAGSESDLGNRLLQDKVLWTAGSSKQQQKRTMHQIDRKTQTCILAKRSQRKADTQNSHRKRTRPMPEVPSGKIDSQDCN